MPGSSSPVDSARQAGRSNLQADQQSSEQEEPSGSVHDVGSGSPRGSSHKDGSWHHAEDGLPPVIAETDTRQADTCLSSSTDSISRKGKPAPASLPNAAGQADHATEDEQAEGVAERAAGEAVAGTVSMLVALQRLDAQPSEDAQILSESQAMSSARNAEASQRASDAQQQQSSSSLQPGVDNQQVEVHTVASPQHAATAVVDRSSEQSGPDGEQSASSLTTASTEGTPSPSMRNAQVVTQCHCTTFGLPMLTVHLGINSNAMLVLTSYTMLQTSLNPYHCSLA